MKKFLLVLTALLLLTTAGCKKKVLVSKTSPTIFCSPNGELVREKTIQSHRSYCLQTQKDEPRVNEPLDYSFAIIDDQGAFVKDFAVAHEKIMHVIVIRKDLDEFQHLHPEFNPENGYFTVKSLTLPSEGGYRLYADFVPASGAVDAHGLPLKVVLSESITVGNSENNPEADLTLTPSPQNVETFVVSLKNLEEKETLKSGEEIKLTFHVDGRNNAPIEHVDYYLGAKGHLVILKEGSLEYLHVHPEEKKPSATYNDIPFYVTFPEAGKYALFLEFKHGEKVRHVKYVVEVLSGEVPSGH